MIDAPAGVSRKPSPHQWQIQEADLGESWSRTSFALDAHPLPVVIATVVAAASSSGGVSTVLCCRAMVLIDGYNLLLDSRRKRSTTCCATTSNCLRFTFGFRNEWHVASVSPRRWTRQRNSCVRTRRGSLPRSSGAYSFRAVCCCLGFFTSVSNYCTVYNRTKQRRY